MVYFRAKPMKNPLRKTNNEDSVHHDDCHLRIDARVNVLYFLMMMMTTTMVIDDDWHAKYVAILVIRVQRKRECPLQIIF